MPQRDDAADALRRLLHQAVHGVTDLVEQAHDQVAGHVVRVARAAGVGEQAEALDAVRKLVTKASLVGVRGVNAAVRVAGDTASDVLRERGTPSPVLGLAPLRGDPLQSPTIAVDAALGGLNGAIGDRLALQGSPLDLGFGLRFGDAGGLGDVLLAPLGGGEEPDAALDAQLAARVENLEAPVTLAIFVHGLCTTEWSFCLGAEENWGDKSMTFARRLHDELGLLPLFARYNTGRPIGQNGEAFAAWLDRLDAALARHGHAETRYVLIGHSMGGLVSRATLALGMERGSAWAERIDGVATLGTPHHGAPLEKVVAALTRVLTPIPWPATTIPAALLGIRSAGIRDLARGEPTWRSPAQTRWLLVASTVTSDTDAATAVLGDGMVTVGSALAKDAEGLDAFDVTRRKVAGVAHATMANDAQIYAPLVAWLREGMR
ncbi:MAG: hypothetical protein H6747_13640 [Deltaproteobacteria bacterium]|nr:hypothetical protein [Deltaproteobacteria bacterium]